MQRVPVGQHRSLVAIIENPSQSILKKRALLENLGLKQPGQIDEVISLLDNGE